MKVIMEFLCRFQKYFADEVKIYKLKIQQNPSSLDKFSNFSCNHVCISP